MIPIKDLIYDVEFKLNKVATNRNQSIPREDIIIALNEAQIQLVKQKVNINNIYKLGTDSFNKRYDDLKDLIPPDTKLSVSFNRDPNYVFSITPTDYMFFIKCYILANKGTCIDRKIDVNIIPHADTVEWLNNEHLRPNFLYQETIGTISSDGINIYTGDDKFIPTALYLTYIRYPKQVDLAGYDHFDGTPSIDVDCELPAYLKDELVDLAVQELAMSTENFNALEVTNQRLANDE